jgi:hypothetical protein
MKWGKRLDELHDYQLSRRAQFHQFILIQGEFGRELFTVRAVITQGHSGGLTGYKTGVSFPAVLRAFSGTQRPDRPI